MAWNIDHWHAVCICKCHANMVVKYFTSRYWKFNKMDRKIWSKYTRPRSAQHVKILTPPSKYWHPRQNIDTPPSKNWREISCEIFHNRPKNRILGNGHALLRPSLSADFPQSTGLTARIWIWSNLNLKAGCCELWKLARRTDLVSKPKEKEEPRPLPFPTRPLP